jgi:hypothetical protein
MLTLPEHLSSPRGFSGDCAAQSYVFNSVLLAIVCLFIFVHFGIGLSALRFTTSDKPSGVFKLFLKGFKITYRYPSS